ncbi:MAG: DUF4338 domain-containing protein [Nitrosomonas sp.]|uniref:Druantia anti-phage system protein DruA n=1 Tax=Nitrosomonas sp. TaxID=42353 RepID=UPI00273337F0|nr:Druantia anti-phage system protein DruA [Nitrosomonas sp.]MDP3281451.1 DUF4338 domain-containing protein [Nitrosomonas sp.]
MPSNLIFINAREANLKRRIREHLKELGYGKDENGRLLPPDLTKETYRKIHGHQRVEKIERNKDFINRNHAKLLKYFARGDEIIPAFIRSRISLVRSGTLESDLFRFASLYWRIPVSEGYGRRIRFLVWDDSNGKLIGIFALGDAVFNLKARDEKIGWSHQDRMSSLINLMDAYVMGAIPPYNMLLGGKLVACLIRTQEVVDVFREKYKDSTGIISGQKRDAHLLAVTTTSALGRSSIYNRLRLAGLPYFSSLGFTSGWGHFHIPEDLFDEMRAYLVEKKDDYASSFEFGGGPNWRLRTIKKVLAALGLSADLAQHGLVREVFFCEIATNAIECLQAKTANPIYGDLLSASEVSNLAIERWIAPRALRNDEYLHWCPTEFMQHIDPCSHFTVSQNNVLRKE